jgi:hypothetical protein
VDHCKIYGNGVVNSVYQHNSYTESQGIVFQYNQFGPLRAGCPGNNLKDRSAGCIIRYNTIQGGNRELDLVDAEDSETIRNDPAYHQTFVHGNVLIEPAGDGNTQIVHYGGDSGTTAWYRKGTLFFYNNTLVSKWLDSTTVFRLSSNEESVDARNNILYTLGAGKTLALVDSAGNLVATGDWLKQGFVNSHGTVTGTVQLISPNVTGTSPGFANEAVGDYRLSSTSPCVGKAVPLRAEESAENTAAGETAPPVNIGALPVAP